MTTETEPLVSLRDVEALLSMADHDQRYPSPLVHALRTALRALPQVHADSETRRFLAREREYFIHGHADVHRTLVLDATAAEAALEEMRRRLALLDHPPVIRLRREEE